VGDEEFVEFAMASSAGLRHAAYLLTGDRHAAEEAVQAALVRAYAAWSRVRRDDAFACARRTLVNYVTDRWRRKLKEYPTDDLPEQPGRRRARCRGRHRPADRAAGRPRPARDQPGRPQPDRTGSAPVAQPGARDARAGPDRHGRAQAGHRVRDRERGPHRNPV
jgi:DNA-directed RNA polymerase specialized sigma24 family protein